MSGSAVGAGAVDEAIVFESPGGPSADRQGKIPADELLLLCLLGVLAGRLPASAKEGSTFCAASAVP
jgi:hypothetical protein